MHDQPSRGPSVAIVGAGSIGVSWAITFIISGFFVRLHDISKKRLAVAREEITERLADLKFYSLVDEPPEQVLARLSTETNLEAAVSGAEHIQECIPEILTQKREIFSKLANVAPRNVIIASSSSFMPASKFANNVKHYERCLVIHPGNPPYLLRIVEIVPASFTSQSTINQSTALMERLGLEAVIVRKEVDGFVFNRLQGALLNEAYALVEDGVASSDEIDAVVRDGLGLRWSVIGPFETVDLNTRGGISAHAQKMGPAYKRIAASRGINLSWPEQLVSKVTSERRANLPLEQWPERVRWRDRMLMGLVAARQKITKNSKI